MLGVLFVSIHVLRVEDDHPGRGSIPAQSDFNPRPPCGGRPQVNFKAGGGLSFQSTSSVWRTTVPGKCPGAAGTDFNPRPPCGGRQVPAGSQHPQPPFQSTSSVWRTTAPDMTGAKPAYISIHVLRVEDDLCRALCAAAGLISIHVLRVEDDGTGGYTDG